MTNKRWNIFERFRGSNEVILTRRIPAGKWIKRNKEKWVREVKKKKDFCPIVRSFWRTACTRRFFSNFPLSLSLSLTSLTFHSHISSLFTPVGGRLLHIEIFFLKPQTTCFTDKCLSECLFTLLIRWNKKGDDSTGVRWLKKPKTKQPTVSWSCVGLSSNIHYAYKYFKCGFKPTV